MSVVAVGTAADVVAACGVACTRAADVPLTFDGVKAVVVDPALIEAGGTYREFALDSKSLNVFARY